MTTVVIVTRANDQKWNIEIINHLIKYHKEFGFNKDELLKFKEEIKGNNEIPLIPESLMGVKENYKIYYGSGEAGNITLTKCNDEVWEIDIFLFDEFQGKSITPVAIKQIMEMYNDRTWKVNILALNSKYLVLKSILESLGFVKNSIDSPNHKGIIVYEFLCPLK